MYSYNCYSPCNYNYSHYNTGYSYSDYYTYSQPSCYSSCYDYYSYTNTSYSYCGNACYYFDTYNTYLFDGCNYYIIPNTCYVPCNPICEIPNAAPDAENDVISNVARGANNTLTAVTVNVLENDKDSDGQLDSTSVSIKGAEGSGKTLKVEGEGTWEVDEETGDITFTPENEFSGNPTAISYNVKDNDGSVSNTATVNVTYEEAKEAPIAQDDNIEGVRKTDNSLSVVTIDVTKNDSDADGSLDLSTVSLIGSDNGKTLDITGEGSWTVDAATGEITFTALDGFIGNPASIEYTVKDTDGITSNAATVTINYGDKFHSPIATNDNAVGEVRETYDYTLDLEIVLAIPVTVDVLENDRDVDGSFNPATVHLVGADEKGQLIVDGEGTWSVNSLTGEITFAPTKEFDGKVTPVKYTVEDNDGLISNEATVSIDYPESHRLTVNSYNHHSVNSNLISDDVFESKGDALFSDVSNNTMDATNHLDSTTNFYPIPQTSVDEVVI